MKPLILAILIHGLGLAAIAQATNTGSDTIQITAEWISQLAAEMRNTHPALKAAEMRTNAAAAETAAVRTWDDPMVRLGGMAGSTMMRANDGDVIYGVEQALPLFGKPQAARRVARAGVAVEEANLDFKFQQLRAALAIAVFKAGLAAQVVEARQEDLNWLNAIEKSAEARYRSGGATAAEFLRVQNETSLRKAELASDKDLLRQAEVVLNRFLGRPVGSPWPALRLPEPGPEISFSPKLIELALKYEPQTRVMRQQIEQGRMSVGLASKQRLPEVKAGVEGRNYSKDGEFRQGMVFMTMTLPWFNSVKYNQDIRKEKEKVRGLEYDLADYERGLEEEIHKLAIMSNSALRRAVAYRDEVLPRTASTVESARALWEAGTGSFADFLDARRQLLDSRLQYATAVAEQYEALSDLVLCCGLGDLEALTMLDKITAP